MIFFVFIFVLILVAIAAGDNIRDPAEFDPLEDPEFWKDVEKWLDSE